jgi:hypothetical protein
VGSLTSHIPIGLQGLLRELCSTCVYVHPIVMAIRLGSEPAPDIRSADRAYFQLPQSACGLLTPMRYAGNAAQPTAPVRLQHYYRRMKGQGSCICIVVPISTNSRSAFQY